MLTNQIVYLLFMKEKKYLNHLTMYIHYSYKFTLKISQWKSITSMYISNNRIQPNKQPDPPKISNTQIYTRSSASVRYTANKTEDEKSVTSEKNVSDGPLTLCRIGGDVAGGGEIIQSSASEREIRAIQAHLFAIETSSPSLVRQYRLRG